MIQAWLLPIALPLFTRMPAPATPQGRRLPAWSLSRGLSPVVPPTPHRPSAPYPNLHPLPLPFLAVETWQVLASLGLSFVICEMGLIIDLSWYVGTLLHIQLSALCLAPVTAQNV